jgi:methionine-rich copper-binding protein CopC
MSRSTFTARMPRLFAFVAAVVLPLLLLAHHANAHARLVTATPAAGGTVAAPKEIRLEFSEGVEPKFTGVTLTSASGATVPVEPARIEAGNAAVLIVPIGKPLSPGVYTVRWHAVSVDTHRTQGNFQFTVSP